MGDVRIVALAVALACVGMMFPAPSAYSQGPVAAFEVVNDAIPRPLTAVPGDPVRGLAVVLNRATGNCVACHVMPVDAAFQGDMGPPLAGIAERYEPGELRLRLVDIKRIIPDSNMPSFHRIEGFYNVRRDFVGRPILAAQEIEDVLAYLLTLR